MLEHEPTDEEIAAFMRHLAAKGYDDLSSEECLKVVEFVIAETRSFDLRLDLRHLQKAWQDYRQDKHGRSKTPWQDLIRTSLQKAASEPIVPVSKRDDIELQRQKVRDAMRRFPDDRQAQLETSGLKQSTFYNRRKEVLAGIGQHEGALKSPHWRRGHFRKARVGTGRTKTRLVFVRPSFINAGYFHGDLSDTQYRIRTGKVDIANSA